MLRNRDQFFNEKRMCSRSCEKFPCCRGSDKQNLSSSELSDQTEFLHYHHYNPDHKTTMYPIHRYRPRIPIVHNERGRRSAPAPKTTPRML